MKKVVVQLNSLDDKIKQNPMQAVASIQGVVSMELAGNKITITGDVDPVQVVKKLRKWSPKLDTVGPAKEEKKKGDEGKKPAGDGGNKKVDDKKVPTEQEQMAKLLEAYRNNCYYTRPYVVYHSCEENPSACVIC